MKGSDGAMPVNIDEVKFRMLTELEERGSIQLGHWLEEYRDYANEIARFAFWAELSSYSDTPISDEAWEDEGGVASAALSFWHNSLDGPDITPDVRSRCKVSRDRPRGTSRGRASVEFKKASVLAWIVDQHGGAVSRFRVHKEAYTLERCLGLDVFGDYKKMPLGPYDPKLKYRDGEPIARKQRMLQIRGHIMSPGQKIGDCRKYAPRYLLDVGLAQTLVSFLGRLTDEELETLTTIDAVCAEVSLGEDSSSLETIKCYLRDSPEWRGKLSKRSFADSEILIALFRLNQLGLIQ